LINNKGYKMRVLLISGSPRGNGNTEVLLNHAAIYLEDKKIESVKFYVSKNKVNPCQGCDFCTANNGCKQNDEMKILYQCFDSCDGIIIGTPVYYRNVSSQLKAIFDRTYAVKNTKPLSGKIGGAIAVGRGTGGGQCLALSISGRISTY
jgi:multimeric flavodoxin WrbA